ncbi:DUF4339 domain-containing protein [Luteolibacter sp. LG18]|uniref:DUF4339 domain-containing protein n=1 Tax=Luteolibacter sp. LG18 TaxID=2819286 RepID=UPI002B2E6260|nr:hypothetical protein llg_24050 [Luteolibacter sp. LG18]
MQWYYSKNGTQLGPIGTEDIKAKLGSGEISATDLVWKEGMADWVPAGQVGELRTLIATPSAAPLGGAPVSTPVAPASPYAPPVAATAAPGAYPIGAGCPKASTAKTLGICGLVFALCCSIVGVVLGILAVVNGNQAQQQIAQNPAWAADLPKAKAGVTMGWIAIGLGVVSMIVSVVINVGRFAVQSNLQH